MENKSFHRIIMILMASQTTVVVSFIFVFLSITVVNCLIALAAPILMTLITWLIYRVNYKKEASPFGWKYFLANLVGYGLGIAIMAIFS